MEQISLLMTDLAPEVTKQCTAALSQRGVKVTVCEKEKNNRKNKGNLSHAGDVFAVVLFSCDGRILVSEKQHPRSAECGIL